MVPGKHHGLGQLSHVGRQQHLERLGRHPAVTQAQAPEHHAEALGRGHLPVRLAAEALRLLPAPEERVDEAFERQAGSERPEGLVEMTGHRAPCLAVDGDLGQPLPIEEDERVEEVEDDGGGGHGSGFLWANPSSKPCQKRTASSPWRQQRLTGWGPAV